MNGIELIRNVEEYATLFYSSISFEERRKSEQNLEVLLPRIDIEAEEPSRLNDFIIKVIFNLIEVLESSQNVYANMYCSQRLIKEIDIFHQLINMQQVNIIKNKLLQLLWAVNYTQTFLVQNVADAYSALVKYFYLEEELNLNSDLNTFLEGNVSLQTIGLMIVYSLVEKIKSANSTLLLNRKIQMSFKDVYLPIFLKQTIDKLYFITRFEEFNFGDKQNLNYIEKTLLLLKSIFEFDFIGTNNDEAGEDSGSSQFPITWKHIFTDPHLIPAFYHLYNKVDVPYSNLVLSTLTPIVSCRRSLFNETEIQNFSIAVLTGFNELFELGYNLDKVENHHEFSRNIFRFRSIYQLNELTETHHYYRFITGLTYFTKLSLQRWEEYPNSVPYLLNTWLKIVSSSWNLIQPHSPPSAITSSKELHMLPTEIFETFLESRVKIVEGLVSHTIYFDDLLDTPELLFEGLESIATIARYRYTLSKNFLLEVFNRLFLEYNEHVNSNNLDLFQVVKLEGKFAWLVYTIGGLLSGRISYQSLDQDDEIDAELSSKVFELVKLNHQFIIRYQDKNDSTQREQLGRSMIYFFEKFQNSYIGDMSYRSNLVYNIIYENTTISNSNELLETILKRIQLNLTRQYSNENHLIAESIQLLAKLTNSYTVSKQMKKLPLIDEMLEFHGANFYPFMNNISMYKYRTLLYLALTKILLISDDIEVSFLKFSKQLEASFTILGNYDLTDSHLSCLSGLSRDLLGIFQGAVNRKSFTIIYHWFVDNYLNLFKEPFILLCNNQDNKEYLLTVYHMLKLFNELAFNRSQRLNFPVVSANGILLFKQLGPVLCTLGNKIMQWILSNKDLKKDKRVQIIRLYFMLLHKILGGGYVSFQVFEVYNDPILKQVLKVYFELILVLPLTEINGYHKLQASYYSLLETVINDHLDILLLEDQYYKKIHEILNAGIKLDQAILSSECCRCIDHILTQLVKSNKDDKLNVYFRRNTQLVSQWLTNLLNLAIFKNLSNTWSFSRPILSIIVWKEELFNMYATEIIKAQVDSIVPAVEKAMQDLIVDLEPNISSSNKDVFTQRFNIMLKTFTDLPLLPFRERLEDLLSGIKLS